MAGAYPVGKGRNPPNIEPYLAPPVGRISFTLNPIKMLNQLTGPKFRKKCYIIKAVARQYGLVAQLDRVFDYESKGRGFESRRAHH